MCERDDRRIQIELQRTDKPWFDLQERVAKPHRQVPPSQWRIIFLCDVKKVSSSELRARLRDELQFKYFRMFLDNLFVRALGETQGA